MDQKIPTILFLIFLTNQIFSQSNDLFYNGFDDTNNDITLSEGALIEKNGILRLTNNTLRLKGQAFYSSPIQFKNKTTNKALSFSTSFAFSIFPQYPGLGGHGFAFTITPSKHLPNALPSQYLGLLNSTDMGNFSNHIVAVEFDTVQDFEFDDINDNHVGIDINSLISNKSVPASYFIDNDNSTSLSNLSLKSGQVIQAWIDYDSIKNRIEVRLSIFDTKPLFPILSYDVDLSVFVKDYMFFGFSSSTGLLASTHYILGWSFATNGEAKSLTLSSLPSLSSHGRNSGAFVVYVSVSVCLVVVLAIAVSVYFVRKIKNREVIEAWEFEVGPHRFSYQELKKATRGFRDKELLGFGGFGKVYKGTLQSSNTQVAIKRISNESKQGLREFVSEIASIGRLRHRNLVPLLGWCRMRSDLLLVYDFMSNGSLDKYLFNEPKRVLTWDQRFNIIKGIASGLLYLHEEWEQTVIHRDIKAGNVLLDSEMNGRLGDFGLAKLYEHGSNPTTTKVVGTLGYLAPELTRTGKPSKSSDVYAFGALMLEVVCGRRPIEPKALPEELILVDWVWEKWTSGAILDVVDRRLNCEFAELEAVVLLKLGLMCSNDVPDARPTTRQIVRYLEGDLPLPIKVTAPDGKDEKKSNNAAGVGHDGRNCGSGRDGDERHEEYVHSYQVSSGDECGGHIDLEVGSASDEFR